MATAVNAAAAHFVMCHKLQLAENSRPDMEKLWCAIERHPKTAKRRRLLKHAGHSLQHFDVSLDVRVRYNDATITVGNNTVLHIDRNNLNAATGWYVYESLKQKK